MYRLLFEHPLVEAITGWDFTDGMWLKAPSGIIRKDNSIEPAFLRLTEMIKGEWWTDTTITTDKNGFVCAEGFKGEYLLSRGDASSALTLDASQEEPETIVL